MKIILCVSIKMPETRQLEKHIESRRLPVRGDFILLDSEGNVEAEVKRVIWHLSTNTARVELASVPLQMPGSELLFPGLLAAGWVGVS